MKKKGVAVVLCLVLVMSLSLGVVSAARTGTGTVVWNSNKTLSMYASVYLNGKTATFKAGIGGPDAWMCTRSYVAAPAHKTVVVCVVEDKNGNKLWTRSYFVYNYNDNTLDSFLNQGITQKFSSKPARAYMKLYLDGSYMGMIESKN